MDAADWRSRFLEEGLHAVVSSRLQRGYLAESCVAESFYGEFDRAIQRRHLPLRGAQWWHAVVVNFAAETCALRRSAAARR